MSSRALARAIWYGRNATSRVDLTIMHVMGSYTRTVSDFGVVTQARAAVVSDALALLGSTLSQSLGGPPCGARDRWQLGIVIAVKTAAHRTRLKAQYDTAQISLLWLHQGRVLTAPAAARDPQVGSRLQTCLGSRQRLRSARIVRC